MKILLTDKQKLMFKSPATEVLIGGAAGPGKSFALRAISIFYALQIPNLQIYLFRRNSNDITLNHFDNGPGSYQDLLSEYLESGYASITYAPVVIKFNNGSRIYACHLNHTKDLTNYQGASIGLLLIDELTHFSEEQYTFLRSRVRLPDDPKLRQSIEDLQSKVNFPINLPKIVTSSNPGGIGHSWVKRTFVDPAPPYEIFRASEEDGGMMRQYIPALLSDNPHLDYDEYSGKLKGLGSPDLVKALLNGSWDIVYGGGCLDDVWDARYNVCEPFPIPNNWNITRAADWGDVDPFAITYYAESNGEQVHLKDGGIVESKPGDLFVIAEFYGGDAKDRGCNMIAEEVAKRVKAIDLNMPNKVDTANSPADTQLWSVINGHNIIDDFIKHDVRWSKASKGPGSRVAGLLMLRKYLNNAKTGDGPKLVFFNHCRNCIRTLPTLPRSKTNPEDMETHGVPDHLADSIKYKLMTKKHYVTNAKIVGLL